MGGEKVVGGEEEGGWEVWVRSACLYAVLALRPLCSLKANQVYLEDKQLILDG